LYHLLLLLPVEITQLQKQRILSAKEKYVPTSSDLNPNTRFIDNAFVKLVAESDEMADYIKARPINFDVHFPQVKQLLDSILASKVYEEYMEMETTDRAKDCEFWRKVMKSIILPSDSLIEMLENGSIYWNDDLEIMGTFALKTIKQTAAYNGPLKLLPKFKDDEDANFGIKLFLDTIHNRETYRGYIDKFIDPKQWDSDRLAFMDIVIMMVAISEIINFPAIPIPVTMNEYIEIANSYSTARSGQFINGMLFSIVKYLRSEGIILKE
ncbi:MAG: transcription antitermination protein NusB, partial [Muribaculaceae bacterium]|nr:transcription antitermination protein NusB [Muribaculaceae bacterium]